MPGGGPAPAPALGTPVPTGTPERAWALPEATLARGLVGVAVLLGVALRLPLALDEHGVYWPDEIYQSLEPAHRLAFGYGLQAWEYLQGARTYLLPLLLAAPLKLADWLGLDAPGQYLALIRLLLTGVALGTGWATHRLAQRLGAQALPAATGATLFLLSTPALYFSHRAMSETVSALPIVLGFALALPEGATRRERACGAALLGLSVFLRLQNGVFCLGLLGVLAARRAWRPAAEALAVLAGMGLLFGLFDWVSWGAPFHSARVYVTFNVLQDGASAWGVSAPGYYLEHFLRTMGHGPGVLLLGLAAVGALTPTGLPLALLTLAFVALHLQVPHKELRFLFPALPLLAALAALGLEQLTRRAPPLARTLGAALCLLALLPSALTLSRLQMGDVGQYVRERPRVPALGDGAAVNRLLLLAHAQEDLCGLKVEAQHLAWTGGYTYLHRPVPLYSHLGPPRQSGVYNYVVTRAPPGGPATPGVLGVDGPLALVKLSPHCLADPSFSDRLP